MTIFCWASLESSSSSFSSSGVSILAGISFVLKGSRSLRSRPLGPFSRGPDSAFLRALKCSWGHCVRTASGLVVLKPAPLACRRIDFRATLLNEGCAEVSNNWPKSRRPEASEVAQRPRKRESSAHPVAPTSDARFDDLALSALRVGSIRRESAPVGALPRRNFCSQNHREVASLLNYSHRSRGDRDE
jgi:hypothetical protein